MQGLGRFLSSVENRAHASEVTRPGQAWRADVTYLNVGGQWRYFVAVINRGSRRLLGRARGREKTEALNSASRQLQHVYFCSALSFMNTRTVECN